MTENNDTPQSTEYGEAKSSPEEAVADQPVDAAEPTKKTGVEIRTDPKSPMTEADERTPERFLDAIVTFMENPSVVMEAIEGIKSKAIPGDRAQINRYVATIQAAQEHHVQSMFNVDPFERQDALWRQSVENNGDEIAAGRPRLANKSGKLSGDAALMRVQAAAGLGSIVNVPLWHTGIWLKLKTPPDSALFELEQRIAMEKIALGRATVGAAFTNSAIYTNAFLVDMIMKYVYDGTYHDLSPAALKKAIRVTDIPQLVWGIACSIWTDGYRLVQPCVHDPMVCNHEDEAHINVTKLSWVDNNSLSTFQKNLMSKRDGNVSDETLTQYRDQHKAPQTKRLVISDSLSIELQVPSIADYENAGYAWIDDIVRMADEAFGQQLRGDERNDYISRQGAITSLRRYRHWISAILFTDDDSIVDTDESLNKALDNLSANEKIRTTILEGVEEFIRSSVINAIGIPRYDCPSCGKGPHEEDTAERLPEIIQLEVNELFFTLQSTRVSRLMESR